MDLERILNPASGFTRLEDLTIKQLQKLVELHNLQTKIKGYKTKTKDQLILELRQKVPNIDAKMGMLDGLTIKELIKVVQKHNADTVIKNYKKLTKGQLIQELRLKLPHLEFAPEVPESITPEAAEAELVAEPDFPSDPSVPFAELEDLEPATEPSFDKDVGFTPFGLGENEFFRLEGTPYFIDRELDVLKEETAEEEAEEGAEIDGNLRDDELWRNFDTKTLRRHLLNPDGSFNHLYNLLQNEYDTPPRSTADGGFTIVFMPNYAMFPQLERGTYMFSLENGDILKDGEIVDNIAKPTGYLPLKMINSFRDRRSIPELFDDYIDPDEMTGDPFDDQGQPFMTPTKEVGGGTKPEVQELFVNLGNFTYNRKKRTIRENPEYAAPNKPTEYRLLTDGEYTKKELSRFPPKYDDTSPEAQAKLPDGRRQLTAEDLAFLSATEENVFFDPAELSLQKQLGVYYPLLTDRKEVRAFAPADYPEIGIKKGDFFPQVLRRVFDDEYFTDEGSPFVDRDTQRQNRAQKVKKMREKAVVKRGIDLRTRAGQKAGQIYYGTRGRRYIVLDKMEGFRFTPETRVDGEIVEGGVPDWKHRVYGKGRGNLHRSAQYAVADSEETRERENYWFMFDKENAMYQ